MNALAALGLITGAGIETRPAIGVLRTYRGEPHRVELVRTIEGRDFIDDSKGTNVGAVAAAVCGLAAQGRRILILMGGDGKGQDFTPLAKELKGRVAFAALIGRDAAKSAKPFRPPVLQQKLLRRLRPRRTGFGKRAVRVIRYFCHRLALHGICSVTMPNAVNDSRLRPPKSRIMLFRRPMKPYRADGVREVFCEAFRFRLGCRSTFIARP